MIWEMPTREEQEKHLTKIGAVEGARVRFRSSTFEWEVKHLLELSRAGSISVLLKSPTSGRKRTAWPWELRAVA